MSPNPTVDLVEDGSNPTGVETRVFKPQTDLGPKSLDGTIVQNDNWLEFLEVLGVNIAAIREKWLAWQVEHPGLAAPLEVVAAELWAGISDNYLSLITVNGAQQLIDFLDVTKPTGPISTDDDPSIFA